MDSSISRPVTFTTLGEWILTHDMDQLLYLALTLAAFIVALNQLYDFLHKVKSWVPILLVILCLYVAYQPLMDYLKHTFFSALNLSQHVFTPKHPSYIKHTTPGEYNSHAKDVYLYLQSWYEHLSSSGSSSSHKDL